jgi:hypothetical protein
MKKNNKNVSNIDDLIKDLKVFIDLSFQEDETSLQDWMNKTFSNVEVKCWVRHQCDKLECLAYKNEFGRCWLIAGTMCGGKTSGTFAKKYGSCLKCDVYKDVVGDDKVRQLRELVIALIYSLRLKQSALKEALAEVKTLSGFLPICASCKKIRDDKGYWNQIDEYIREHSEVEFSHSICPVCTKILYSDLDICK